MNLWSFINDTITNGVRSVKFSQLVKFNPTSNAVETIDGTAIPITVANASKVGTSTEDDLARKDYLSASITTANDYTSGTFGLTDMVEEIATAMVTYDGRSNNTNITTIGSELLPNVDFTSLNNIAMTSGTGVSYASNELRMATNDGNICKMTATLTAGKYYLFKCSVTSGVGSIFVKNASAVDVDGINGYVNGSRNTIFKCTADGVYTMSFQNTNSVTTTSVSFKAPSLKEVDIVNIPQSSYLTIPETKANDERTQVTLVKTGIPVKDINYNPANSYSAVSKNNLAFFYGSFDLMEYIAAVPGKDGFMKDGNSVNLEYFRNSGGTYLGNFASTDANSFNLIGNSVKTITSTNLKISRNVASGSCECYVDNTTGIGKWLLLEIVTGDIMGSWEFEYASTPFYLNSMYRAKDNDTVTYKQGEWQTMRYLVKTTSNVSRLRIINTTSAITDYIDIKSISFKEIDTSIWNIVTPTTKETNSPVYKWDSIYVDNFPRFKTGNTASTGTTLLANNESKHCSLMGEQTMVYSSGWGVLGKSSKFIEYGDKLLRFPSGGYVTGRLINHENFSYNLMITSYDTVRLYVDNFGKKHLIASDKVNDCCMMLSEAAPGYQQQIKHGLSDTPNIANFYNDALSEASGKHWYRTREKPVKTMPITQPYYTIDMGIEEAVFTTTDFNGFSQDNIGPFRIEEDHISWGLVTTTTVKKSVTMYKVEVNNSNRKYLKYQGTAEAFKLKLPFTPGMFLMKPLSETVAPHAVRVGFKSIGSDKVFWCNQSLDARSFMATTANTFRFETDGVAIRDIITYTANDFTSTVGGVFIFNHPNYWFAFIGYNYGDNGIVKVKRPSLTNKLTLTSSKLFVGSTSSSDTRGNINKVVEVPKTKIESIRG